MLHRLTPLLLLFTLTAVEASAQMVRAGGRAGQWETAVGIYATGSESSKGSNGSGIDVDSGYGITFGLGYHATQHLAVRFDASWSRPDYTAIFNTEEDGLTRIDHRLTMFNGQLNGVWNILDGDFTPYLQAGIGWTYIDSNVADGPPTTGCWWDPWWGYICSNFFSTYAETNFSWNVGAGLRYQLNRDMYLRGGYEMLTIDTSGVEPSFDAFRFELGWTF
jgi:opacity protein-like surface antigen